MKKGLIRECIIVGGEFAGGNVLAKTRDRNYTPNLEIVRDLTEDGVEVVYIHDLDTNYLEGMNSEGIGVVNAALLVSEDEAAANKYWAKADKKKGASNDGPRIAKALTYPKLSQVIKSLVAWDTGLKGHTFVGSPKAMYTIEMTSEHNPIVKKVKSKDGYQVRTNHGLDHPSAGYTPHGFPEDYVSSKVRQAAADLAMSGVESADEIAPALATQHFERGSNYNMLRQVDDGMKSSSQVVMNLDDLSLNCYLIPGECEWHGITDKTPEDYEPKIKIKVQEYKDE